jgi:hypothetical protein
MGSLSTIDAVREIIRSVDKRITSVVFFISNRGYVYLDSILGISRNDMEHPFH